MKSQRVQRVAEEIRHELADLLRNEVKDPRVGMVTVTRVDVSGDMSHAKVHFTRLAGREHGDEAVAALARTSGFLRSQLARRLTTYKVPLLGFVYDDSIEAGIALSRLIDEAVAEDAKHPHDDA